MSTIEYRIVLSKSRAVISNPFPSEHLAKLWIHGCLTGPRSLYGVQKFELRPMGRVRFCGETKRRKRKVRKA